MKKKILAVGLAVLCMSVGVVVGELGAHAVTPATVGTPEIDRANATMQFSGTLKEVTCTGEDTMPYETFTGTYTGGITQLLPDPTDYPFGSGPFTMSGIKWTINTATGRGVLTAKVAIDGSATTPIFSGTVTLVSQGLPAAGASVPARGWISAKSTLPDETTPPEDFLIANTEFMLSPTGGVGQFGNLPGSLGIPDFSVVTNMAPAAADGIC